MNAPLPAGFRPLTAAPAPAPRRLDREPDSAVAKEVRFVRWTDDGMLTLLHNTQRLCALFDRAALEAPIESLVEQHLRATPYTFVFGDFEGGAQFWPVQEGHSAFFHYAAWSPRFLRRPALARAVLRDAFVRWRLRRVGWLIPDRATAVRRFAESLGFKQEGAIRRGSVYSDGAGDLLVYGLLAEEL
jgi:RimJ/RimL family protein N-acetyltransferase